MHTGFQIGYGIGRLVGIILPPLMIFALVYGVQYLRTGSTHIARRSVASRWTLIAAGALLGLGIIALIFP